MSRYLAQSLLFLAWVIAVLPVGQTVHAQTSPDIPPLEEYGRLPVFETAAISANGTRRALLINNQNNRFVLIYENGKPIQKIKLGNFKIRDLRWAGDDYVLVRASQTEKLGIQFNVDKFEFWRTLVIPIDPNGKAKIVFKKQQAILDSTASFFGLRLIDGETYLYTGGYPLAKSGGATRANNYVFRGGGISLYRVNLRTMAAKRLAISPEGNVSRDWIVGADGKIAATLDQNRDNGRYQIRDGDGHKLVEGSSPRSVWLVALGYGGGSIIYAVPRAEERSKYMSVPVDGGQSKEILKNVNVRYFYSSHATGYHVGYKIDDSAGTRVFFDPALNKKIAKINKAFPKLNNSLEDWSNGFSKVIARTNGNGDSGTWYEIDLENLSANALGYEREKLLPGLVGTIKTISYKASDGLDIEAILTLPPGRKAENLPVVVLPHGGPHARDTESFDWWAQAIASRGYAVLQPNFRGSTNKGRAFLEAGYGEWGGKMQTDLSDGLAYLVKQGVVDSKRACIMGASYGGYAALAGVTLQQDIYRCAVSVAGVSDLRRMVATDVRESSSDKMIKRSLKRRIGSGKELKDVSPRRFAEKVAVPVMLIHGKDDIVVPYSQSTIMADALKDAGKPYEMVTLDGEDHWLSKSDTRLKMLKAAVAFVEKHNPPDAER